MVGETLTATPREDRKAGAGSWRFARSATSSAETTIEAGIKGTVIRDSVTVASTITCRTGAGVVVDSVLTGASVEAGITGTLIDVNFAALAGKS